MLHNDSNFFLWVDSMVMKKMTVVVMDHNNDIWYQEMVENVYYDHCMDDSYRSDHMKGNDVDKDEEEEVKVIYDSIDNRHSNDHGEEVVMVSVSANEIV